MKADAVGRARERLASAQARLTDLQSAKDYVSTSRYWYEFLLASNGVFNVLEQGAKGSNKSKAWFGNKKHERRSDSLLRYLHQARHVDEHGLGPVTELEKPKVVLVEDGKPIAAVENMVGNKGIFRNLEDQPMDPKKISEMRIYRETAKLIPVFNRGVRYDPPTEHMGSKIEGPEPMTVAVAKLMVQYLEPMVAEAETLGQ
ncbi:MAG: hypothetical protein K8H87_15320 [Pseudorhodoplanes sp.]|nr:hypothetical protein [Pseudorhodoplanes sp.]